MSKGLTDNQQKEISKKLADVVQIREDICFIMNRDCRNCPLNKEDKCSELNLPEFDFKNYEWLYNEE